MLVLITNTHDNTKCINTGYNLHRYELLYVTIAVTLGCYHTSEMPPRATGPSYHPKIYDHVLPVLGMPQ